MEWAVLVNTYVHRNDNDAARPVEAEDDDNEPLSERMNLLLKN